MPTTLESSVQATCDETLDHGTNTHEVTKIATKFTAELSLSNASLDLTPVLTASECLSQVLDAYAQSPTAFSMSAAEQTSPAPPSDVVLKSDAQTPPTGLELVMTPPTSPRDAEVVLNPLSAAVAAYNAPRADPPSGQIAGRTLSLHVHA